MKTLDDALAATELSDQLAILNSLHRKSYPELLDSVQINRKSLYEIGFQKRDDPEYKELFERQSLCLQAAELIAYQGRKRLPKNFGFGSNLLLREEIVEFLVSVSPEWFPALFSTGRYSLDVINRYMRTGAIHPLPEGHSYYSKLPEYIAIKAGGRMDSAKEFLKENPWIVTSDLHFSIRAAARKKSTVVFQLSPVHPYVDGLGYFRRLEIEDGFSVMRAVGDLCLAGDFELNLILRTVLETLFDAPRELDARIVMLVHEQLAPTPARSLDLQAEYFSLLTCPHKAFVKLAVDSIRGFFKLRGFDAAGFIDHMAPVFLHGSNPLLIAGLKLLRDVAKAHPDIGENVPSIVVPALLNPNLKVQTAVADVLKALPASASGRISEALSPYADRILGTLQTGFAVWLQEPNSPEASYGPQALESKPETGVRLDRITSSDELAFVANELLTRDIDPMRLELFLDGLAAYAAENRAKLAETFSPLQMRASKYASGRDSNGFFYSYSLVTAGELIVMFGSVSPEKGFAISEERESIDTSVWPVVQKKWSHSVLDFGGWRIEELATSIFDGRSAPLLSVPEYDTGFIRFVTLQERLRMLCDLGLEPLHFDFIQAIARCQTCGVCPSDFDFADSGWEAARVLRFLVTGEVFGEIRTPAWWLTAARTREPLADFSNHSRLAAFDRDGEPDWSRPAIYRRISDIQFERVRFDRGELLNPIEWPFQLEIPANHLYPLQHSCVGYDSDIRWRYSFTPGFLDAVVAVDINHTCYQSYLTGKAAAGAASAVMTELVRRRLPLRYPMQVHMLLALNSSGQAEREAGVDLFIQASLDGRLDAAVPGLGRVFSELLRGGLGPGIGILQLSRITPALRQLGTNGPVIQVQLRDILLRGLEHAPTSVPKGLARLLELLLDLVVGHPPERSIDLNAAWGGMLEGKDRQLADRIANAGK